MKGRHSAIRVLVLALLLALVEACAGSRSTPISIGLPDSRVKADRIVVVCDNNYPPYAFARADGQLEGIVPDLWAAWSRATGLKVEVRGLPWSEALAAFDSGKADVLDTVFRTEAREGRYDFTPAYARLDVLVFTHRSISGIASPEDLRGFRIAAKEGDSVIDTLRAKGVTDILALPDYESIVREASARNVRIFTIDGPPALYLLYKYGIDAEFKIAFKLGEGAFHRAVRKGDAPMLALVNSGFRALSDLEMKAINDRWLGSDITRAFDIRVVALIAGGVSLVVGLLLALAWTLRRRVSAATNQLREKIALLEESERRNKASIAEKEVLLKEVHHRVKNNMQVISSLIQLQSYGIRDEADQLLLLETQERIRAMAQLHELLYRSRDLSSIDAAEYIGAVVNELAEGHGFVGLEYESKSAMLGLDASVPLGLIANELVINSIKYAYPETREGPIRVSLSVEGAEVVLGVRDEGRGLPSNLDPATCPSMGLTLVRSLADQLKGRLIWLSGPGFGVELRFVPF